VLQQTPLKRISKLSLCFINALLIPLVLKSITFHELHFSPKAALRTERELLNPFLRDNKNTQFSSNPAIRNSSPEPDTLFRENILQNFTWHHYLQGNFLNIYFFNFMILWFKMSTAFYVFVKLLKNIIFLWFQLRWSLSLSIVFIVKNLLENISDLFRSRTLLLQVIVLKRLVYIHLNTTLGKIIWKI
jgi:hypothetical protein